MKGRVDLQKTLPHLHQPTRPLWPGFFLWRFCRPLRGSTNDGATRASRSLPRRHLALILTANSISGMPFEEGKRIAFSFYISDFSKVTASASALRDRNQRSSPRRGPRSRGRRGRVGHLEKLFFPLAPSAVSVLRWKTYTVRTYKHEWNM